MASLKKPAICGYCESTSFIHKYDPERWECAECEKVIAQRPQRISGVCRKCGASEKDKPFKKGKNLCLECDNKYMVEWRKKNPGWNDSPEFKKKRFETVKRAIQKSPESFIKHLFLCLTRPSRKHKKRHNTEITPRRLAALTDIQITLDHLISLYHQQDGKCAITGVRMCHVFGQPNTISIDRIDSLKGYTPDNIHLVCQWVNLAKSKYNLEVFKSALDDFLSVRRGEVNFICSSHLLDNIPDRGVALRIEPTEKVGALKKMSGCEPCVLGTDNVEVANPCGEMPLKSQHALISAEQHWNDIHRCKKVSIINRVTTILESSRNASDPQQENRRACPSLRYQRWAKVCGSRNSPRTVS